MDRDGNPACPPMLSSNRQAGSRSGSTHPTTHNGGVIFFGWWGSPFDPAFGGAQGCAREGNLNHRCMTGLAGRVRRRRAFGRRSPERATYLPKHSGASRRAKMGAWVYTVFALRSPEISCQAHRSLPAQGDNNNQVSFLQHLAHGLPTTGRFFPNGFGFVHVQHGVGL
jgi:hypothetical protein